MSRFASFALVVAMVFVLVLSLALFVRERRHHHDVDDRLDRLEALMQTPGSTSTPSPAPSPTVTRLNLEPGASAALREGKITVESVTGSRIIFTLEGPLPDGAPRDGRVVAKDGFLCGVVLAPQVGNPLGLGEKDTLTAELFCAEGHKPGLIRVDYVEFAFP